jgi:thymidine kinase
MPSKKDKNINTTQAELNVSNLNISNTENINSNLINHSTDLEDEPIDMIQYSSDYIGKTSTKDDKSDNKSTHSDDSTISESLLTHSNILDLLNVVALNENSVDDIKKNLVFPDGYLKLVIGCMFSGKTSYIIRECKKWQSIGKNVLMINYALDTRYTNQNKVVSHDKYSIDCMMVDKFSSKLSKKIEMYDVILINEAQFFSDLRSYAKHWCDDLKKIVVVSGLDGDYLRGRFGEILDLIPDCDELIKLKAYCSFCKDGTDAIFTWKIKDNPTDVDVVIDIGSDKYVPLCRKHYNNERYMMANLKTKTNK